MKLDELYPPPVPPVTKPIGVGTVVSILDDEGFYKEEGYLIAQVNFMQVAAIGLTTGNRWSAPVNVESALKLTSEELEQIFHGCPFEKIEVTRLKQQS